MQAFWVRIYSTVTQGEDRSGDGISHQQAIGVTSAHVQKRTVIMEAERGRGRGSIGIPNMEPLAASVGGVAFNASVATLLPAGAPRRSERSDESLLPGTRKY